MGAPRNGEETRRGLQRRLWKLRAMTETLSVRELARTLGPLVETDPQFPARTNVEFARHEADGSLTLWVWERGCGITAACGTGACATLAAAVAGGLAPTGLPVRVQLPGGPLLVRLDDDRVWMTGPARVVFRGELLAGEP